MAVTEKKPQLQTENQVHCIAKEIGHGKRVIYGIAVDSSGPAMGYEGMSMFPGPEWAGFLNIHEGMGWIKIPVVSNPFYRNGTHENAESEAGIRFKTGRCGRGYNLSRSPPGSEFPESARADVPFPEGGRFGRNDGFKLKVAGAGHGKNG